MSAVADKLDEARALIERGWTRHVLCQDGRVCAMGAIYGAFNGSPTVCTLSDDMDAAIRLLTEAAPCRWIGTWNDAQPSKKPVIDAFKRAAELARAGEQ